MMLFQLAENGDIRYLGSSLAALRSSGKDIGGRLLVRMTAHNPADLHTDKWEMHPGSDELIHVLEGTVSLVVERETGTERHDMAAGDAHAVPRGLWHRFDWRGTVSLLVVTEAAGTKLREVSA